MSNFQEFSTGGGGGVAWGGITGSVASQPDVVGTAAGIVVNGISSVLNFAAYDSGATATINLVGQTWYPAVDHVAQFVYDDSSADTSHDIIFAPLTANQTVAYQSWVTSDFAPVAGNAPALTTGNATNAANAGVAGALFYNDASPFIDGDLCDLLDHNGNVIIDGASGNIRFPYITAGQAVISQGVGVESTGAFVVPVMTANSTGTITFNSDSKPETIYNTSSSIIASAAITLPTSSAPGQICRYVTAGAVTTVTMAGGTVDAGAALTTLLANSSVAWQSNASGHWIRIQ